jgi:hypothetical protein
MAVRQLRHTTLAVRAAGVQSHTPRQATVSGQQFGLGVDIPAVGTDGGQSQQGKQRPTAWCDRSTSASLVQVRGEQQTGHEWFRPWKRRCLPLAIWITD